MKTAINLPETEETGTETPAAATRRAGAQSGRDPREEIITYLPALRAFALALSRDPVLADDLVQETLLKSWSKFHLFQEGTNLRSWLFTILRNNMRTLLRKHHREVEDVDEKMAARLASKPSQETSLVLKEVEAALAKLPAEQREVLLLVGAMGFSIEEAAETCGCATGTIKSRANRGRKALAQLLGMEPGETVYLADHAMLGVVTGQG